MPVPLVALKKFRYANQSYAAGEAFDARDEADASVLKATGLAKDDNSQIGDQPSDVDLKAVARNLREHTEAFRDAFSDVNATVAGSEPEFKAISQDMRELSSQIPVSDVQDPITDAAEQAESESPDPEAPRRRRSYRRRDMQAEE